MADGRNANTAAGQRKFTPPTAYKDGFTPTPNAVLRDPRLTGNAKTLYALLLDAGWRGEEPELPELGAMLGGGKKTAMSAMKELTDTGYVTSKRRGQGKTNAYLIHSPDESQKFPDGTSRSGPGAGHTVTTKTGEDADVEAGASTSGAGRPVFDAIAKATGANVAISAGEIAKAEKAIRQAERDAIEEHVRQALAAQPELDEIPKERIDAYLAAKVAARAALYRERRPDWELTPSALAKHWLRVPTWTARQGGRDGLTPAELARLDLG